MLPDSLSGDHEIFRSERCLKEIMVSKFKMLSVVCLEQKHCTNLKMCTKLDGMVFFDYRLQTPLSVTILRTKKVGIGYPVLLAAVLNCHKKHLDYDPVPFSALSVE